MTDIPKISNTSDSLLKESGTSVGSADSANVVREAATISSSTSSFGASFEDVCSFPNEGALFGPTLSDNGWICMWRTSLTGLATIHYTSGWESSLPVLYDMKTKLP